VRDSTPGRGAPWSIFVIVSAAPAAASEQPLTALARDRILSLVAGSFDEDRGIALESFRASRPAEAWLRVLLPVTVIFVSACSQGPSSERDAIGLEGGVSGRDSGTDDAGDAAASQTYPMTFLR
jgi:hypothetical protein